MHRIRNLRKAKRAIKILMHAREYEKGGGWHGFRDSFGGVVFRLGEAQEGSHGCSEAEPVEKEEEGRSAPPGRRNRGAKRSSALSGREREERLPTTGSAMSAFWRTSLHPWLHSLTPIGVESNPPEVPRTRVAWSSEAPPCGRDYMPAPDKAGLGHATLARRISWTQAQDSDVHRETGPE